MKPDLPHVTHPEGELKGQEVTIRAAIRLLIFMTALSCAGVASAQTKPSPMIERYYECFDASTRSQFTAKIDAEPNMVAERAFQACATEEQTIMTYLSLSNVPQNQAWAIILRHRAALKRRITG